MKALAAAGYRVYPANPKQAARHKETIAVSGKKDDFFDAGALAERERKVPAGEPQPPTGRDALEEAADRIESFRNYQVNETVVAMAKKDALVMHCLPAHRGQEITHEVLEGPQCIAFDQAENRLHIQKAIMAVLMGGERL